MNNIKFDKEYICYIGNRGISFYTNDHSKFISLKNCFGKFVFHIYKNVVVMFTIKDGLLYRYFLCNTDYFNKETFNRYKIIVINNE